MDKLKMHSPDLTAQNIDQIAKLFPTVITESLDEEGKPVRAIDFDLLRQELTGRIIEGPQERYQIDWPGKREALVAANAPITETLRPVRGESVNFDTTKNLFIEGENLDALKLLQESYLGKINLIYIDPPYNTGNDFIYDDDYSQTLSDYLVQSGQADGGGNRLRANPESDGRFHSKWLSMMYPRLRLARNLMAENAFLCMSIDDAESRNARAILDEVFGARNFVATIVWQKRYVSNATARHLSDMHDFVHVYARNAAAAEVNRWPLSDEQLKAYRNPDNDGRGPWRAQDLSASKPYQAGIFTIERNGLRFDPPPNRYWRCNKEKFEDWDRDGRIWWGVDGTARPMLKSFLSEKDATATPHTWWDYESAGHNKEATLEMKDLFGGASPFDTPKPVRLLRRLLDTFAGNDARVLDFFAGSGTTAHATLAANAEDGGSRQFIVVQLDQQIDNPDRVAASGHATISGLAMERIRKAGERILASDPDDGWDKDVGFRVLRVDSSSRTDVAFTSDDTDQSSLLPMVSSLKSDRTADDLLFQVLLEWGLELTSAVSRKQVGNQELLEVEDGALIACFDQELQPAVVRSVAQRLPLRAVFRDSAFATDADRINAQQIFREISPTTDVRVI